MTTTPTRSLRADALEPTTTEAARTWAEGRRGGGARSGGNGGFLSRWHVLEAAMACFEAEGYEGVTIRAIARRLGCSVGSIYRYFTDKLELLRACGERAMRPAVEAAERRLTPMDEAVEAYAEAARRRPEVYRLMAWLGSADATMPESFERVIAGWSSKLGDRGEAQRRWALVHGMICLGGTEASWLETAVGDSRAPETTTPVPEEPAPASSWRSVDPADDVTLL